MAVLHWEVAERLRAFRAGSGLSADQLAKRLGISRAALYRLEKGEVVKIETLEKLSKLVGVPMAVLLGVGFECLASPVGYFERLRQLEKRAEHIIALAGSIPFLLASNNYINFLRIVLTESVPTDLPDRETALGQIDQIISILVQRKEAYHSRRPGIFSLVSSREVKGFAGGGFAAGVSLSSAEFDWRRKLVLAEISHLANVIEEQSIDVQIGVIEESLPNTRFQIFRMSDTKVLSITPFRLSERPNVLAGVAIVTSADEAISLHEKVVQDMWRGALKGAAAAEHLREIIKAA